MGGGGGGKEGKGEERAKAFSFCHARDFLLDIMEAGWPRGKDNWYVVWWSREQAHHPDTHWIVLKMFPELNSLTVLCIKPTTACLLPVGVFTAHVYLQCLGPNCLYLS